MFLQDDHTSAIPVGQKTGGTGPCLVIATDEMPQCTILISVTLHDFITQARCELSSRFLRLR